MKICIPCKTVAKDDAPTCLACGEASWGSVTVAATDESDAPPVAGGEVTCELPILPVYPDVADRLADDDAEED